MATQKNIPHSKALTTGGDDYFLIHLISMIDNAEKLDIAVAFTMKSGIKLIIEHLRDFLNRNGKIRFLTGDYLDGTEPEALRYLLDLQNQAENGQTEFRIFEAKKISFHPKTYISYFQNNNGTAYVGSSNLSRLALTEGIEWNYRIDRSENNLSFLDITNGFENLFGHKNTKVLNHEWIDNYEARRRKRKVLLAEIDEDIQDEIPTPHPIQEKALAALIKTRDAGNKAGLVVLATGLGKTWLSAFDSLDKKLFKRILFVAHREEILSRSMEDFRNLHPKAKLGMYTGKEKTNDAEILFASIQTLGRLTHLKKFEAKSFDYIIMDEFHHACAKTYRNLINHFDPKFLLGLTATPERMDGGNLLSLCHENLVYRCDLFEGIEQNLLCKFKYFGVPDDVDYSKIKWRSNQFDEEELTNALANDKRAQNVLEQFRKHKGKKALGFCSSTRHADYMAKYFNEREVKACAVHSGEKSYPRAGSLEKLENGEISIIFSVDMFNEGIDIPAIDTVMMLRPTQSTIIWMQQFGRGLRLDGDKILNVIDYIGNHRIFLTKIRAMFQLASGDAEIHSVINNYKNGRMDNIPQGCEVTYELESIDIITALLKTKSPVLEIFYTDFKLKYGVRPTATEVFEEGCNPSKSGYDSWFSFVQTQGDLNKEEKSILNEHGEFFKQLAITSMSRSYKMLTLLSMLNDDAFPGEIHIDKLTKNFTQFAKGNAILKYDVSVNLDDFDALKKLITEMPIQKLVDGKGMGKRSYFSFDSNIFKSNFNLDSKLKNSFQEMTREICDFRLAKYLSGSSILHSVENNFKAKIFHSDGKPIIKLPDRNENQFLPNGLQEVLIGNERHQAMFAKIAINKVTRIDSDKNILPDILRGWFGENAGLPGTVHNVSFKKNAGLYEIEPDKKKTELSNIEYLGRYSRIEIPPLFDFEYSYGIWGQSGFIIQDRHVFLLVTLEKKDLDANHAYDDKFISPEKFQWQSQNRTRQASKHGEIIRNHANKNMLVHLFVRPTKKQRSKTVPFTYFGEVDFISWKGEKPITVEWRLKNMVPDHYRDLFKVGQ